MKQANFKNSQPLLEYCTRTKRKIENTFCIFSLSEWVLPARVDHRTGVRNESHIEIVDASLALQQHQEARAAVVKARSRSQGSRTANRQEKATSLVETEQNSRAIAKSISGSSSKQVSTT